MAPSACKMPGATASPSSIPGATGTPSPRVKPWTFKDTAARVLEVGPLHGCAAGSGSPAGSGSLDGGGPPHPARAAGETTPAPAGHRVREPPPAKIQQT